MANLISIGEVIDKSWDHYIDHFKQLMIISLWALLVPALMIIRIFIAPDGELNMFASILEYGGSALLWAGAIIGILIALIAVPVITIWIYINLIKAIDGQAKKKSFTLQQLRVYGWKNFFSYIWVALLRAIIIAVPALALIPGVITIYFNISLNGGVLFGVISTLLMLAGVIFAFILITMLSIQLNFASFERLIGEKRGTKAISGSRALVDGRFWKTLVRIVIPKFVFLLIVIIMQFVVMFILSLGSMVTIFSDTAVLSAILGVLNVILLSVIGILTTPMFIIVDYIIYDSLLKTR